MQITYTLNSWNLWEKSIKFHQYFLLHKLRAVLHRNRTVKRIDNWNLFSPKWFIVFSVDLKIQIGDKIESEKSINHTQVYDNLPKSYQLTSSPFFIWFCHPEGDELCEPHAVAPSIIDALQLSSYCIYAYCNSVIHCNRKRVLSCLYWKRLFHAPQCHGMKMDTYYNIKYTYNTIQYHICIYYIVYSIYQYLVYCVLYTTTQ